MPTLSLVNESALFAAVLILGSLAGYFSERVGIVNIGIDGQMICGGFFFALFATIIYKYMGTTYDTEKTFIGPLLLAGVCTIPITMLFGFLTIKLKTNQTIAGTAINLLSTGVFTFLTNTVGQQIDNKTTLTSEYSGLLRIGDGTTAIYIGSLLILAAVIIIASGLYVMMKKTPFGLRLTAIGENPNAADAQGINVYKYQWIALSFSGFLAGLAGGIFVYSTQAGFRGSVNGAGFLALAILIAGTWRIPLLISVSICFAIITKTVSQVNANIIPQEVGKLLPYLITLVAMVAFSKYSIAPKNLGMGFDKSKR
ncbi:sugar ABC transporter [Ureaplasma diversum]|uniref:Ribose/Galactose ABC transporter, permease component II n=2 Tax=Ureaplasma diversum TaxID=42094 RepID=A0A084EXK2_9BACT|nr:ABC transporter permease [Ureaplasma diversum]AJQ45278.1 sugar ABC transporter [Ureaplasma diversum]KEZ22694.1 Ribose/Galactose ABC transporter, permease component II [Ureaplasma diversum NCTC 246]